MKRIASLAGAGCALLATPALAMDEGAMIAMLSVMGAVPVGVISGGIFGWLRKPFLGSLGWTFAVGMVLMLIALLAPRGGLGDYIESLLVAVIVSAVPLALGFAVAYGIASLLSSRRRKAE